MPRANSDTIEITRDGKTATFSCGPVVAEEVRQLRRIAQDLLYIVQEEYDDDPEPEDLTSWTRAIAEARAILTTTTEN